MHGIQHNLHSVVLRQTMVLLAVLGVFSSKQFSSFVAGSGGACAVFVCDIEKNIIVSNDVTTPKINSDLSEKCSFHRK